MTVGRYEVRTILIPPLVFWTFLMSAGHARAADLELPFEIEASQAAILVRGLVDGKPVLLILDTGASSTILARELVRLAPGALASSRFSAEGPGLNANGRYTEATLELGDRRWRNRTVVGMKMDEVSKAYGRRIDGLLGQDVLREFDRITIDFRTKRLLLSTGE
jgi:predicted aspartyl protease